MAPAKRTRFLPRKSVQMRRCVKISRTITTGSLYFDDRIDKEKYCDIEDVATNLQKVFFTGKSYLNGQVLDYEMEEDGSNIHMNLHVGTRIQIFVKMSSSGKLIPLDVCGWDTIHDVKTKLQDKEGTPANQLTLIYNGKQLEDFDTLEPHGVQYDSIFYAVLLGEEKIKIFIKLPKKVIIKLEVKLCSSVENIKSMVHCMVGFPIDQQKLTFNGVLLKNDRIMADYKIQMESVLDMAFLAPGFIKIFVNRSGMGTFPIFADSSDTIDDVKKKIQYTTGVNQVQTSLLFGGQRLSENRTVGDYNIQKEDTIDMMIHQCGC